MRASTKAIERGITFLANLQAADGSFATQLSVNKHSFHKHQEIVTTFTPALLLQVLRPLESTYDIREELAKWLMQQQSANGAFNYWPVASEQRASRPYPDDLDDTSCALTGLYAHDKQLIGSAQLAKLVRLLLAAEKEVGGPYKTWLVGADASPTWQDVDPVVNSNILYLLQQLAEPLPKLQALIARIVEAGDFRSPYYASPLLVLYFLARTSPAKDTRDRLVSHILQSQKDDLRQSPLQTALACTALRNLGHASSQSRAINYLIASQLPDGSWPAESVWVDEARSGRKVYAGSPALTTAFVLEALTPKVVPTKTIPRDSLAPIFRVMLAEAKGQIATWPAQLRKPALSSLAVLRQGETGREVLLLPHLFAASLAQRPQVSDQFLTQLSLANIFGWMAYTIYDDFLDDEGQVPMLPVANAAMRQSLSHFAAALPGEHQFQKHVQTSFDRIDAANAWEVINCRLSCDEQTITIGRLPRYKSAVFLAERSIGHCLTPLAVLTAAGNPVDCQQTKMFAQGFSHYLAARQLNDDLHDWQEDIRKGHISYVAAELLRQVAVTPGRHSIAVLLPKLERQFWHTSLAGLCAQTSRQLVLSRRAFSNSKLLRNDAVFFGLIDRLEKSMSRTLDEQKSAQEFLKHYTS